MEIKWITEYYLDVYSVERQCIKLLKQCQIYKCTIACYTLTIEMR